ncbi:putative xenobiotic-transporting ATPase [Rosa chinensis]|uniref:Putative xenobiotic-transporting ATPase n=1 Tax=Rosa chinensis TaxID=74649 RepID=A0A2P6R104_ROSCH|nr:putative xenobiotic-transporting ATPase [Rosa chinensis]
MRLFITLAYWYGGRLMNKGTITAEHVFQTFFLLMSTGKSIAGAGSITSDLAKGYNAIASVFSILDRSSEIQPDEGNKLQKTIKGHIELKNVFFSYPARPEQMIFKGLNLTIEAGRTMELVGHSVSGNTIVIGLVERFYDPVKGSVHIDQHNIKNYNLRQLRYRSGESGAYNNLWSGGMRWKFSVVAATVSICGSGVPSSSWCSADPVVVARNLWGRGWGLGIRLSWIGVVGIAPGSGWDRVVEIAGLWDNRVGGALTEVIVSRIAIARAILKNLKVLLLDEATTVLDSVSETLVQEALGKMMVGRTCVVVAHRLSTMQRESGRHHLCYREW